MDRPSILLHATSVDLGGKAVVLRGPPGSGKSDLALRLIDGGATLIADDQTRIEIRNSRLTASPPATIAGMIEVRGMGLYQVPFTPAAVVGLLVDLAPEAEIERLPDPEEESILGIPVPRLRLAAFHASTPAKLRLWAASTESLAQTAPQQGLTPVRKIVL